VPYVAKLYERNEKNETVNEQCEKYIGRQKGRFYEEDDGFDDDK
jgi:hypothetical protein